MPTQICGGSALKLQNCARRLTEYRKSLFNLTDIQVREEGETRSKGNYWGLKLWTNLEIVTFRWELYTMGTVCGKCGDCVMYMDGRWMSRGMCDTERIV